MTKVIGLSFKFCESALWGVIREPILSSRSSQLGAGALIDDGIWFPVDVAVADARDALAADVMAVQR